MEKETKYIVTGMVIFIVALLSFCAWTQHEKEITKREAIKAGRAIIVTE